MKHLQPFWFAPEHQPREGSKVEFELRPLDMATYWTLQASYVRGRRIPEWDGVAAAFEHGVVGWRGLEKEFSEAAKRAMLATADPDSAAWLGAIAGELYARALLKEDERKNS